LGDYNNDNKALAQNPNPKYTTHKKKKEKEKATSQLTKVTD
jgi:hypothetical protein